MTPLLLTNDLMRHTAALRPSLDTAVNRVLKRGWFVHGPELEAFESEFAAFCGTAACVGVANGTDALELALRAVGIGQGSSVATVANAGMYATVAILACGARPVYVDIDERTFNMDPAALSEAAASVDAVVVTHLYGCMAPMPHILAAAMGKPVIEDCAQAHGAVLDGRPAGSWGIAGTWSFYPTKNLGALGDGGAVTTSDPTIAARLRALRQYGWTAKYTAGIPGGRNSRLDEMQAAILRELLPFLPSWNERRREIAALYGFFPRGGDSDDVVHLYTIQSDDRDRLQTALRTRGIGADIHYPIPDYRQAAVMAAIGFTASLPATERVCARVLTLPCFPEMTEQEVRSVADAVSAFS